ncbi:hypothetical protein Tco_0046230 [Tanacetum coccineum]
MLSCTSLRSCTNVQKHLNNKDKILELTKTPVNENCSAVILKTFPEKLGDPGRFLIPCDFPELNECLALADLWCKHQSMPFFRFLKANLQRLTKTRIKLELADRSISTPTGIAEDVFVKVGTFYFPVDFVVVDYDVDPRSGIDDAECDLEKDILLLEAILNSEPLSPLPNHANYFPEVRKELKICEAKTNETSIDEPPEVELKDIPPHLEYAFLEGDNKLPVIIAKDLSVWEKAALIKVLQSHKRAITWKLSDIKGINPEFCTHKILMERGLHNQRSNIRDGPWVSPVHYVPKKGGFTVVENEQNELIPIRLVTGWQVIFKYAIDPKDQKRQHLLAHTEHLPTDACPLASAMHQAHSQRWCYITFFLGLQVKQKEDGIFIRQNKYVTEILKKFSFSDVKTASTPMETHKPLLKDTDGEDIDEHMYKSMIGSLMYLTSSRPDIMFVACVNLNWAFGILRIHLFDLVAYTDSDYTRASLDRKSTTGGCQFLGCMLISWQCKKQTVVMNSITEAEYIAASNCCGQVLWIQNQLLDYRYNFMQTKIHIDNKSTICIVRNPVFHSKTKHIEIRHHFIRDSNEKKLIQMIKIHTDQNVTDLLTKAFDASRFQYLIASIGLLNL